MMWLVIWEGDGEVVGRYGTLNEALETAAEFNVVLTTSFCIVIEEAEFNARKTE